MTRHIDRKQLKSPDQFVTFWQKVGIALAERRGLVLALSLGVVALMLLGWGAQAYLAHRQVAASAAFARIEGVASAALLPESGDAGKEAPPSEDGLPRFKTEKERLEAAVKEADTFLSAHGGSRLRDEALLLKARYLLALDRAGEAVGLYQELAGGALDEDLRFLAREGLGYALEANGERDKAIAAFGALADQAQGAGGFYRDRALFQKARLLAAKGDAKAAEAAFREILDKVPTTMLRDEINDRLASLEKR